MKKIPHIIDYLSLEEEHSVLLPAVESFCLELRDQLNKLLEDSGVALGFPVQYRVKQWESILEKLDRVSTDVSSVKDFQDLAGLRIILLFRRDVQTVGALIRNNFTVIRQYDTQDRLQEDQFGYSSVHFVIELRKEWLTVPTLARMGGLKAEIQVRTLAQHIWAEVSHTLQYKQEQSVPPSVRRAIHRLSALLETIDLEFDRVLSERDAYLSSAEVTGTDEKLNVDLLAKTLDSLLPQANKKVGDEPYSELLEDLNALGITTQRDLVTLIKKHLKAVLRYDAYEAAQALGELDTAGEVSGTSPERTRQGVFFTHVGLVRQILPVAKRIRS